MTLVIFLSTVVECDHIKEKNDYISWREAKTYHIPSFTWRWVTVKKIIIIISEEGWKNIQQGVLQQEIFSKSCNGTLTYTEPFWDFSFFAFFFFFFFSILFSVIGNPTTQKSICHPLSFSILSWQDLQFLIEVTHTLFFLSSTWWMMVFGCI